MEHLKITIKTVNLQKKHIMQMRAAGLKEMEKKNVVLVGDE